MHLSSPFGTVASSSSAGDPTAFAEAVEQLRQFPGSSEGAVQLLLQQNQVHMQQQQQLQQQQQHQQQHLGMAKQHLSPAEHLGLQGLSSASMGLGGSGLNERAVAYVPTNSSGQYATAASGRHGYNGWVGGVGFYREPKGWLAVTAQAQAHAAH
jgi:hypothetical protein